MTRYNIRRRLVTVVLTLIAASFAIAFLMPTVLTIADSFMSQKEITANYGAVFGDTTKSSSMGWGTDKTAVTSYIGETINLKLIPDTVSFEQYITVLIKSPEYLLKFWNSVILVVPIVVFQVLIASFASYSFAFFRGKMKSILFFVYVVLMLMPYQVTLVPNYLVADWLGTLDTYWAIWLPGIFAPFSVFLLSKFMRRIPTAYLEAARLDGAGHWKIFTKICMPLCRSALASIAILVFIDYWNMVEQPIILMMGAEDLHPLSVYLSKINSGETGLAFAVATIYLIPTLLIFLFGEEYLVEGIAYSGGVKG